MLTSFNYNNICNNCNLLSNVDIQCIYIVIDLTILVNQFGEHTCLALCQTHVMVLVIPVH